MRSHRELRKAVVCFEKSSLIYRRQLYGYVSEEDLGDKLRVTFLVENLNWISHYLLSFGSGVEISEPEELRDRMGVLVEELQGHYARVNTL